MKSYFWYKLTIHLDFCNVRIVPDFKRMHRITKWCSGKIQKTPTEKKRKQTKIVTQGKTLKNIWCPTTINSILSLEKKIAYATAKKIISRRHYFRFYLPCVFVCVCKLSRVRFYLLSVTLRPLLSLVCFVSGVVWLLLINSLFLWLYGKVLALARETSYCYQYAVIMNFMFSNEISINLRFLWQFSIWHVQLLIIVRFSIANTCALIVMKL